MTVQFEENRKERVHKEELQKERANELKYALVIIIEALRLVARYVIPKMLGEKYTNPNRWAEQPKRTAGGTSSKV